MDDVVEIVLGELAARRRSDDADVKLHRILARRHLGAFFIFLVVGVLQRAADIDPRRVGTVVGDALEGRGIVGRAEQFRAMAGIEGLHVPYRGTPEMMADLIAGRTDFAFISVVGVLGAIKDGRLVALASGTDQRSKLLPDVPTTVEAGVPGSSYNVWLGLFVPGTTPPDIVDRLNRETVAALKNPETTEKLAALGADVTPMSPAAFDAYVAKEMGVIRELVKTAKIPTN